MNYIEITHNPFTVETIFMINGEAPADGCRLSSYKESRLQLWVEKLFDELSHLFNGDNRFHITFKGVGWFISTKVSDYLSIENGGVKSNLDEVLSLLDKLHLVYEKTAPKSITVGITGGWILSRDELKEHFE